MPTTRKKKVPRNELKPNSGYDCNLKRSVQAATKKKKIKKIGKKHQHANTTCKNKSSWQQDNALGIDRLLAPFNKFYKKKEPSARPINTVMINLHTPKTGLSPKEKNYILSNCQQRSSRYIRLKALAAEAEKKKKVFLINGNSRAIRNALVDRGWVEKIPAARMDLSTIRNTRYSDVTEMHRALERLLLSNFVEKSLPSFIWNLKLDWESERIIQNRKVIHNKMKTAALWSTKQGLCSSIRDNYWFYIEDVADVISPRTYNSSYEGDKEEFVSDYKLTACTSLLKWILSMVANDRTIFSRTGTIGLNVIVFALNRCKEYLFQRQNRDIDKPCTATSNSQWNAFLKKYYILIAKQDTFTLDIDNKLPLYLRYAKFMVKEIHKFRPQVSCEGCHNIWIIKPACSNRGRGIRLASKLGVLSDLLNKDKYVFQKYIEESMLIHETKFDVRQYYLVTSTFPLVIWMYKDCYLKFSSQKYNLKNYHESIHLTNNAVQKKYKNCQDRHPELPAHNMWTSDSFKKYLIKTGRDNMWETVIYPGMKKSIIGVMLSCQESTSDWKNRFELYGCDFILDKDCRPWLIEINSGPDLNPTTEVTAEICPAVLTDVIKVLIDRSENPRASTGSFECIYRQNISMPPFGRTDDLIVQGTGLPNDYFYTGEIQLDDQHSLSGVYKQNDVASVLKKLKLFNTDKMSASNSHTYHSTKKNKSVPSVQKVPFVQSSSFDQIKKTVTVLTDQLDSLLDHITSVESPYTSRINNKSLESSTSDNLSCASSNNFRHNEEVYDFESGDDDDKKYVKSKMTRCVSEHSLPTRFGFSELDDGPQGKGSGLMCSLEKVSHVSMTNICDKNEADDPLEHQLESRRNEPSGFGVTNVKQIEDSDYLQTTKKVFSFLNRKCKEYSDEINYLRSSKM